MRINQYIAQATGLSRRAADQAIRDERVRVNDGMAVLGDTVTPADAISLDNQPIEPAAKLLTIMLHKPVGYVCSRDGQGAQTIYDLLPAEYHPLKPVGRLDKDSSGLLLLTNNGALANQLTHPRYAKTKIYEVMLNKPLAGDDQRQLQKGVQVEGYLSRLQVKPSSSTHSQTPNTYEISMAEGRNRQIRRTFAALDYTVTKLHRTQFGPYTMPASLTAGEWTPAPQPPAT